MTGCAQVYETDSAEPVNSINDTYWTMRAEAVPEDELDIPEGDRIIFLCHVSVNEGKHVRILLLRQSLGYAQTAHC